MGRGKEGGLKEQGGGRATHKKQRRSGPWEEVANEMCCGEGRCSEASQG